MSALVAYLAHLRSIAHIDFDVTLETIPSMWRDIDGNRVFKTVSNKNLEVVIAKLLVASEHEHGLPCYRGYNESMANNLARLAQNPTLAHVDDFKNHLLGDSKRKGKVNMPCILDYREQNIRIEDGLFVSFAAIKEVLIKSLVIDYAFVSPDLMWYNGNPITIKYARLVSQYVLYDLIVALGRCQLTTTERAPLAVSQFIK